jgi:hypothetical protein
MASPDYLSLPPELFLATDSLEAALMGHGNYGRAFQGRQARQAAIPQIRQSIDTANALMRDAHKLEQDNDIYKARLDAMVGLRDVLAQAGTLGLGAVASSPETLPTNLVELFDQDRQEALESALLQNTQRIAAGGGGNSDDGLEALEGIEVQLEGQGGQTIDMNLADFVRAGGDTSLIADPRIRAMAERALVGRASSTQQTQRTASPPTAMPDLSNAAAQLTATLQSLGMIRVNDDGTIERVR